MKIKDMVVRVLIEHPQTKSDNVLLCQKVCEVTNKQISHESITRSKRKLFQSIRENADLFKSYYWILPNDQQKEVIISKEKKFRDEFCKPDYFNPEQRESEVSEWK